MQYSGFRLITILCILILAGGAVLPLYGGGASEKENRLQRAEELIEERRYNEAMTLLSEVMKQEPEKFDRAEALMEEVRSAREEYNQTYERLISILNIGPEEELDEQQAYAIIQRLEELDADPNEASVEAFAQARRSIIFTVNDQEFNRIMREANARLAEGAWSDAVDLYLSGFSLHRDLFQEVGYGELQNQQIENLKESIREAAKRFKEFQPQLEQQTDAALEAVENAEAPLEDERMQEVLEGYRELLGLWDEVATTAGELEALRLDLLGGEDNDIPYLSTLRILSRGRNRSEEANGIAGAIERAVDEEYGRLRTALRDSYRNFFTVGREEYYTGDFEAANSDLTLAIDHAAAMAEVNRIWSNHLERSAALDIPAKTGLSQRELRSSVRYVRTVQNAAEEYLQLPAIAQSTRQAEEQAEQAEEAPTLREAREVLQQNQQRVTELQSQANEFVSTLKSRAEDTAAEAGESDESGEGEALQVMNRLQEELRSRMEELRSAEAEFVRRIAELGYQPPREGLSRAEENLDTARSYVEGVEEQITEESEPVSVRYPRRSADLVEESRTLLQEAANGAESVLEELSGQEEYLATRQPVQEARRAGEALLERIGELRGRAQDIAARAQELNRQADLAVEEGNLRFQEAQAQLERGNFERARDKLEQASDAFSQSLNYREDEEVRTRIDEDLPELAETILDQQNQAIVREVRGLISRGRELFFQENFIEAEKVLQRAQSRWLQTHPEDDPEINIWLERVQRALETTSGVRIATTDPLYPDMMQVLNLARKDYREGAKLYEEGQEEEAMQRFREAEKKIEYVKEPFPNNKEAGVLYLRILEYTSPQDFSTIFNSRFTAAREKIETVPEEAYRELQVLKEIKPDYPGMDEAIREAEIATGIRQPPPDPEKLARARELYQQAQEIVEEDVRARFPVALTYLNEALKLNPDFEDAIVLKDRVQAGQGGQVRVVLDSVDQQKLRRAEELFIESRYYEASAIVNQLYQDPENRKNPKLIELRRRIESKL